jgi:pilus assembly protein Flp/PilA
MKKRLLRVHLARRYPQQTPLVTERDSMLIRTIWNVVTDDEGATMVEYAIMVSLIAAVCIAVVTTFGKTVSTQFTTINTSI